MLFEEFAWNFNKTVRTISQIGQKSFLKEALGRELKFKKTERKALIQTRKHQKMRRRFHKKSYNSDKGEKSIKNAQNGQKSKKGKSRKNSKNQPQNGASQKQGPQSSSNNPQNTSKTPKIDPVAVSVSKAVKLSDILPLSAHRLKRFYQDSKHIKIVKTECPIDPKLMVLDSSLRNRKIEDDLYLKHKDIRERLRKGNTLIKVMDKEFKLKKYEIARKGLPKFFDLRGVHVDILTGKEAKTVLTTRKMETKLEFNALVEPLKQAFWQKKLVDLVLKERTNGENAQISFVRVKRLKAKSKIYPKKSKNGSEGSGEKMSSEGTLSKNSSTKDRNWSPETLKRWDISKDVNSAAKNDNKILEDSEPILAPGHPKMALNDANEGAHGRIEGYWVACSKNVAILFNTEEDLKYYSFDERFSYALPIARTWLSEVAGMSQEVVFELKNQLSKLTLIGEFCGNKKMQHLVRYPEEQLIFFAVVPKHDSKVCLPEKSTKKIFEKFSLKHVKTTTFSSLKTLEEVGEVLYKLESEISASTVSERGEGSILYIESREPPQPHSTPSKPLQATSHTPQAPTNAPPPEVITMVKINSLEYKFFGKLRQRLKNWYKSKQKTQKLVKKFVTECQGLTQKGRQTPAHPIKDYYEPLAVKAFEVLAVLEIDSGVLHSNFSDFLILVTKCFQEEREPSEAEIDEFRAIKANIEQSSKQRPSNNKKVGPNIILIAPPGFISFPELKAYSESQNLEFSLGLSQKGTAEGAIRLCLPSQCKLRSSKVKPYTYCVSLSMEDIAKIGQEELTEAIANKYKRFEVDGEAVDDDYRRYMKMAFSNIFLFNKLKDKIRYELQKLKKAKMDKGFFYVKKYVKEILPEYRFDIGAFDDVVDVIRARHELAVANCVGREFDLKEKLTPKVVYLELETKGREGVLGVEEPEGGLEWTLEGSGDALEPEKSVKKVKNGSKNLIVYAHFYGVSCLGKSNFVDRLVGRCQELGDIAQNVISSDVEMAKLINPYMAENPEISANDAIKKFREQVNANLFAGIHSAAQNAKKGKNLIILDKAKSMKKLFSQLPELVQKEGFESRIVALYPQSSEFLKIDQNDFVPFSASLVINICDRVIKRQGHLTLNGENHYRVYIVLSFILLYKNIKSIPGHFSGDTDYYAFIGIPFDEEKPLEAIPAELVEKLRKCFLGIRPFQSYDLEVCDDFCRLLTDSEFNRKLVDDGVISWPPVDGIGEKIEELLSVFEG